MLLDGLDVGPLKWHVCGPGLNWSIHEGPMVQFQPIQLHGFIYYKRITVRLHGEHWKPVDIDLHCLIRFKIYVQGSWFIVNKTLFYVGFCPFEY